MENAIIQVPAMGRGAAIGMLYNQKSDSFVPGYTLWNNDGISRGRRPPVNIESTNITFHSSNSTSARAEDLNISGAVKVSLLGGLIQGSGSAKYVSSNSHSNDSCKVTMKIETKTRFEQIGMDQLGQENIQYPAVFDNHIATHVVVGITYGAVSVFSFERDLAENENRRDVQGSLEVSVTLIPGLSVSGMASVDIHEEHRATSESVRLSFYGDVALDTIPTNFIQAIEAVRSLPNKIAQSGGVPIIVDLLPLHVLNGAAARIVREISADAVNRVADRINVLKECLQICNDIKKCKIAARSLTAKVDAFQVLIDAHLVAFQRDLCVILPDIRGGGREEGELLGVLHRLENSAFNTLRLLNWVTGLKAVAKSVDRMFGEHILTANSVAHYEEQGVVDARIFGLSRSTSAIVVKVQYPVMDNFIVELQNVTNAAQLPAPGIPPVTSAVVHEVVGNCINFLRDEVLGNIMAADGTRYRIFVTEGSGAVNTLSCSMSVNAAVGATHGALDRVSEPLSYIAAPQDIAVMSRSGSAIKLRWQPPAGSCVQLAGFDVAYRLLNNGEWREEFVEVLSTQFTVQNLNRNTEYEFKVRGRYDLRLCDRSDQVTTIFGQYSAVVQSETSNGERLHSVVVRNFSSFEDYTLNIPEGCTTEQLKEIIRHRLGPPASKQRLFTGRGELSDYSLGLLLGENDNVITLYRDCEFDWFVRIQVRTNNQCRQFNRSDEIDAYPDSKFEVELDRRNDSGILEAQYLATDVSSTRRDPRLGFMCLCGMDLLTVEIDEEYDMHRHAIIVRPRTPLPAGSYYLYPVLKGSANGIVDWLSINVAAAPRVNGTGAAGH